MINTKKIFTAVFCAAFFSFSLFAQTQSEVEIIEYEELSDQLIEANRFVMTIIEPSQPHDLNPKTSTYVSDAQLLSGVYEGLFSYDPQSLAPVPAICEKHKISRDKKRWTFTLRQDARFSDGSPITAKDVRRSWLELMETPDAPYSSMLDIIKGAAEYRTGSGTAEDVGITAVSDNTLSIRLTKAASYLPSLLCHSAFSVTHRNPTVFSGAYSISDIKNNQIILEKNEYYWDAQNVSIKIFCFFQSLGNEENAHFYNTGFTEWITSYDVDTSKILSKNDIQISAEFGTEYFFFKDSSAKGQRLRTSPVWDNEDFRLAVLEAMPLDILRGNSLVPAPTFVYPLADYPEVAQP